jgi:hypothetical protein
MMFKVIIKYPAILVMPMFSPWTIGSFSPGQNSFQCFETCCQSKKLAVSSIWTWLNILVTTTGMIIFPVVLKHGLNLEFSPNGSLYIPGRYLFIYQCYQFCPIFFLSIMITGLLLHAGKRAQNGCCRGCKCCFPCRKKTVLDPTDIETLIYVQDGELIYFEGEEARVYRSPSMEMAQPGSRIQNPGSRTLIEEEEVCAPSLEMAQPGSRIQNPGSRTLIEEEEVCAPSLEMAQPGSRIQNPGSRTLIEEEEVLCTIPGNGSGSV